MAVVNTRRMYFMLRNLNSILNLKNPPNKIKMSSSFHAKRFIHSSSWCLDKQERNETTAIVKYSFQTGNSKNKDSYLDVLRRYESEQTARRGHVEFMKIAMYYMDEFGVNRDLEVYKRLIDIMPKGRFIAKSPISADFMHYPRHQQLMIDLLEKMEDNGVIPDEEVETMLLNIFGQFGIPLRRFWRMMYWMPKFRHKNPWPIPEPVPSDPTVLARLAIEKITSVDVQTKVTTFNTEDIQDSIDKTWVVSAIAPEQQKLLKEHPKDVACYVEGPFTVWMRNMSVLYFQLKAEARPEMTDDYDDDDVTTIRACYWENPKAIIGPFPSIHEQEDATIYAICATGTSSKDSLLSWIRYLQKTNPVLENIPVLFTFTSPTPEHERIADGKPEDFSKEQETRKIGEN